MLSQNVVTQFIENKRTSWGGDQEISRQYDTLNKTVDYLKNICYETFFFDYLIKNRPCIMSLDDIKLWKSSLDWTADGKPNFDFLEREFGLSIVPVADCNVREYNSQKKKSMLFKDYIEYWRDRKMDKNSELLYLKDWHFKREYPGYNAYETPEYFTSDWLNEFCENQEDDYQFLYMGPKGTWTPLHSDVFGSYSWSVNICGRKKWLLLPPGHENFLKDESKQVKYMTDENYLDENDIFYLKIIQEAGEIIFVPSGWYHQVWNLEDTISLNHNWFNGCNIQHIWKCLYQASIDVENEIADIKEFDGWEDQWQIILKAHHGMNFADFLQILQVIVDSRIQQLKLQNKADFNWHFIYDLFSIKSLCLKIFKFKVPCTFLDSMNNLYLHIENFFNEINNMKNFSLNVE